MEKKYLCPDCGGEMAYGYITPTMPCDRLIWAPPECFKDGLFAKHIPVKELKNISDSGLVMQVGNGGLVDMLEGYCCRRCGNVLIKAK